MNELIVTEKPKRRKTNLPKEIEKASENFNEFDNQVKNLTFDEMNKAPKQEVEPLTKLSQQEIRDLKSIVLKPKRTIASREKFNEKWRSQYEFDKEYVQFIAEHRELIGENIELWTKPYPGMPAEEWEVPTGKPVWGPRYLAEQIKRKSFHRLVMDEKQIAGADGHGSYFGRMVAKNTVQRLDAIPVSTRKSIFMGA